MKKLYKPLTFFLLSIFFVFFFAITVSATTTFAYLGDINNDGKVSATDSRKILRIAALLDECTPEEFVLADVDSNKKINASDARATLRVAALLEPCIEVPADNPTVHNDIIPKGGTYYVGVSENKLNPNGYTNYTVKYEAGEKFPKKVTNKDVYVYGDYEYRFNKKSTPAIGINATNPYWEVATNLDGWAVRVLDDSKQNYGIILESINNKEVTSLQNTFRTCTKLVTSPALPETINDMTATFYNCSSLIAVQKLPDNLINMSYTFAYCSSLIFAPPIPANVVNMSSTFEFCKNLVIFSNIPQEVENTSRMFYNCTSLKNEIFIKSDSINNAKDMFHGCTQPITIIVDYESLSYLFLANACRGLDNIYFLAI